ncbi:Uncharacterised protein [Streptococcus agalactiae]|nr:glycerophosphoryl diester phosphodiesterase family protein [Streptococcus agalactiae CNCTC 10/84]CNC99637.1 Uncharacterised protein [Streptococcus agalactiae]CNG66568.1 Uncharacterised protein [Streptococcus agalactiae]
MVFNETFGRFSCIWFDCIFVTFPPNLIELLICLDLYFLFNSILLFKIEQIHFQYYNIMVFQRLLDITENPFVALLFMFGTDKQILNPQFESYQIYEEHESKSIVSFVDKTAQNKRIKAKNGAFLNYDKLEDIMQITDDDFQIDLEYCPINRVIINVEIEKDYTIKYLEKNFILILSIICDLRITSMHYKILIRLKNIKLISM